MKPNDTNQATPLRISGVFKDEITRNGIKIAIGTRFFEKDRQADIAEIVQAVNLFALHEAVASAAEEYKFARETYHENIPESWTAMEKAENKLEDALSALKAKKEQLK